MWDFGDYYLLIVWNAPILKPFSLLLSILSHDNCGTLILTLTTFGWLIDKGKFAHYGMFFFNTRLSKDLVRILVHYFLADTLIPVYYCSILEMNKILFSLTQSSNYLLINRHSLVSQIYLNLATNKDFVVSIDIEKRENMWQWFILSKFSNIYLHLKKLVIPYICG